MMSVDDQARALADWLAEHPGSPPPEGLDPEVVEAVYMLRPDLAPMPALDLDALFDEVLGGGLSAEDSTDEAVAAPISVVATSAESAVPVPANRAVRWWTGVGAVLAVAAAMLLVVRVSIQGASAPGVMDNEVAMAPSPVEEGADSAVGAARQAPGGAAGAAELGQIASRGPEAEPSTLDAVADLGEDEVDDAFGGGGLLDLRQEQQAAPGRPSAVAARPAPRPVASPSPAPEPPIEPETAEWTVADADDELLEEEEEAREEVLDLGDDADLSVDASFQAPAPPPPPSVVGGVVANDAELDVARSTSLGTEGVSEVMVVESAGGSRREERRRDRAGRSQDAPSAAPAMAEEPALDRIDPASAARAQAAAAASQGRYAQAFATLSPYISPSASGELVVEAVRYAYAAEQWRDVIRIADARLASPSPSDTAQQRATLFDLRARAQALQAPIPVDEASSVDP